jgi:uncharacterized repeat protein (TIGR01451 family)
MMKKLLIATIVLFTGINAFSQAVAYPVNDINQCNNEVFDLTVQIPAVLGDQNPADFDVSFFETEQNAEDNEQPITNPTFYVPNSQSQEIYIRVTNMGDASYAITSFIVTWGGIWIPSQPNVTVCSSYVLPPLNVDFSNYYTGPNGTGTMLLPGDMITVSITLYIYGELSGCTDETSFTITVLPTPVINIPESIIECESYTLPPLSVGTYFTQPGGGGVVLPAGTVITSSQVIYVYAASNTTPSCSNEKMVSIAIIESFDELTVTLNSCNEANVAVFDLTQAIEFAGDLLISYYETEDDAENQDNAIQNPSSYYIAENQKTVYARISNTTGGCYAILTIDLVGCTNNTISGKVTYDIDGDGCSASDQPASNVSMYNIAGNTVYQTFTDENGYYIFTNMPAGSSVVTVVQNNISLSTTPGAYSVSMPGDGTHKDFCISAPTPVSDVTVNLVPLGTPRPGFNVSYSLVYSNNGTYPVSGTATVYYESGKMTFNGSNNSSVTQSPNSVILNYINLQPLESKSVILNFTVLTPPTVNAGDVITIAANILPGDDDNASNNTDVLSQTVVNSYDPNDILVREGEYITQVQAEGYLHYTIRFQNTGTAHAVNVRLETLLDANLDWETFQPIGASHGYRVERSNGNLQFFFDNINLAYTALDEPASHGFVSYKIKPKASVSLGDSMSATAAIYFDFNEAIITNTVTTTVQNVAGNKDFAAGIFTVYPNPALGTVTLNFNKEVTNANVTVHDVMGKKVLSASVTGNQDSINISALTSGIYFISAESNGKSVTKKLVVK